MASLNLKNNKIKNEGAKTLNADLKANAIITDFDVYNEEDDRELALLSNEEGSYIARNNDLAFFKYYNHNNFIKGDFTII